MPPFIAYPVFGNVLDSIGDNVSGATLKVTTTAGTKTFTSGADGIYMFDLATVGYTPGETVTIDVIGPFNNELTTSSFVVEGFWNESNITLAVRTLANETTGGLTKSILHSVGNKPITLDNPLPTLNTTNPVLEYGLAGTDSTNRIFGYLKPNGSWYIMKFDNGTSQNLYVKGSASFVANWDNRTNLKYQTFDVVFG